MVNRGESVPLVIPDEQMERFRFMLDYSDSAVSLNDPSLIPGEKVQVIKRTFIGTTRRVGYCRREDQGCRSHCSVGICLCRDAHRIYRKT